MLTELINKNTDKFRIISPFIQSKKGGGKKKKELVIGKHFPQ